MRSSRGGSIPQIGGARATPSGGMFSPAPR